MKIIIRLYLLFALSVIGCSNSDDPVGQQDQEDTKGVVDPLLVGLWSGTINGGLGEADITIELKSDGTMSGEGENSPYCPLNTKWVVVNGKFSATGNDECDGTSITMTAAYSKTRLQGSWNASSGNKGSFDVSKQ